MAPAGCRGVRRVLAVLLLLALVLEPGSGFSPRLPAAPLPAHAGARSPVPRHACPQRLGGWAAAGAREACAVAQRASGSDLQAGEGRSVWSPASGKKPLVILIGFLGCTPGILAKYAQIYEAEGVETVQVLPSIPSMLLAHQGWRGNGSKRVRRVRELIMGRSQDSEVIVHLFSNNGFVFFGSCMMADAAVATAVSAVIMDSCPSYITPTVAATGLLSALLRIDAGEAGRPGSKKRQALEAVLTPVLAALETRQQKAWEAWEAHHPIAPHLFMYSDGDEVVSPSEVAKFVSAHASRLALQGAKSQEHRWEGAGHCDLLRHDSPKYAAQVRSFLHNYL